MKMYNVGTKLVFRFKDTNGAPVNLDDRPINKVDIVFSLKKIVKTRECTLHDHDTAAYYYKLQENDIPVTGLFRAEGVAYFENGDVLRSENTIKEYVKRAIV